MSNMHDDALDAVLKASLGSHQTQSVIAMRTAFASIAEHLKAQRAFYQNIQVSKPGARAGGQAIIILLDQLIDELTIDGPLTSPMVCSKCNSQIAPFLYRELRAPICHYCGKVGDRLVSLDHPWGVLAKKAST